SSLLDPILALRSHEGQKVCSGWRGFAGNGGAFAVSRQACGRSNLGHGWQDGEESLQITGKGDLNAIVFSNPVRDQKEAPKEL
ncbi:MAG: hypothetical protein AAF657_39410, partial [Acidobacteriota bacterium]